MNHLSSRLSENEIDEARALKEAYVSLGESGDTNYVYWKDNLEKYKQDLANHKPQLKVTCFNPTIGEQDSTYRISIVPFEDKDVVTLNKSSSGSGGRSSNTRKVELTFYKKEKKIDVLVDKITDFSSRFCDAPRFQNIRKIGINLEKALSQLEFFAEDKEEFDCSFTLDGKSLSYSLFTQPVLDKAQIDDIFGFVLKCIVRMESIACHENTFTSKTIHQIMYSYWQQKKSLGELPCTSLRTDQGPQSDNARDYLAGTSFDPYIVSLLQRNPEQNVLKMDTEPTPVGSRSLLLLTNGNDENKQASPITSENIPVANINWMKTGAVIGGAAIGIAAAWYYGKLDGDYLTRLFQSKIPQDVKKSN
jgi:hypothetical protein